LWYAPCQNCVGPSSFLYCTVFHFMFQPDWAVPSAPSLWPYVFSTSGLWDASWSPKVGPCSIVHVCILLQGMVIISLCIVSPATKASLCFQDPTGNHVTWSPAHCQNSRSWHIAGAHWIFVEWKNYSTNHLLMYSTLKFVLNKGIHNVFIQMASSLYINL
jgi:hypothetical protein